MLALQYTHHLPSDYDMSRIRERARRRGPLWDASADIVFKAFVVSERGRHSADANTYASVYVWEDTAAAAGFLAGDRFRYVVDAFGRPAVETGLVVDLQRGVARTAAWLERGIEALADGPVEELLDAEHERIRRLADRDDVVAAWSVLDARTWQLTRFALHDEQPPRRPGSGPFEVLHLAAPGLRETAR